jgi:thiol-disulfide isomerase/thioredoxin
MQLKGADSMILLFTSDHCTWCSVLKSMLETESEALGTEHNIYEVDVERQHRIAEAYDILAIPTIVAGSYKISGVPTACDLRSFLLQAISGGFLRHGGKSVKSVLREVRRIKSSEPSGDQVVRTIT